MPDFTENVDRHFNNNSMFLARLAKQLPIQNEKNKIKELKVLLIFAYE